MQTIWKFISAPYRHMLALAAIVMLVSLGGCGAFQTLEASRDIYNDDAAAGQYGKNDVTIPKPSKDWFLVDMSNRYGLMALFALTAYRYDLSAHDRDAYSCAYLNPDFSGDKDFGMPRDAVLDSHWERWAPASTERGDAIPCFNEGGLFYETYVRLDKSHQIVEAVIAYRGTENRSGQWAIDWRTNLSNAFGFEPEEYYLARLRLKKLTDQLRKNAVSNAPIYAVGHSLGGGLAQQAGYLSKDITEVFTFNTTPVTNWTNLRLLGLVEQGYPIIHRVYNGGEGLAGIRSISTAATATRYGRHDVEIQFGPKSVVAGHLMGVIACNFAEILHETKAQNADHGYTVSYIDQYVRKGAASPSRSVCDEENKGDQRSVAK